MKQNGKHIDDLFREGVNKEYPVDQALWEKARIALPVAKKPGGFILDSILIIGSLCALIASTINYGNAEAYDTKALSKKTLNLSKKEITNRSNEWSSIQENPQSSLAFSENPTSVHPSNLKGNGGDSESSFSDNPQGHRHPMPDNTDGEKTRQTPDLPATTKTEGRQEMPYSLEGLTSIDIKLKDFSGWNNIWPASATNPLSNPKGIQARKVQFYLGAEAEFGVWKNKTLEMDDMNQVDFRLKYEKIRSISAYRFLAGIETRRLFFETGFGRTSIIDKLNYKFQYQKDHFTITEGKLEILQNNFVLDGQDVTLIGRRKDTTFTTTTVNAVYNDEVYLQYNSIPFKIGYIHDHSRFSARIWVRPEVHMLKAWRGNYIQVSPQGWPLELGDEPKHHNLLSAGGGLDLGYRLTSHWLLRGSLSATYMQQSSHIHYNQRFNWWSGGVSINRYF